MYKDDCEKAKVDPKYVVLTVDLEQVFFSPELKNSSSFYLKKLSNYNLGIHDSHQDTAEMFLWNETIGKRGSNDVSSCLYNYCTSKFTPLQPDEERELIVWVDRCRGQNNNFFLLFCMITLVWSNYFTNVNQKFFVTGHSFNDCDRDFGMIEKEHRKNPVIVPNDLESIIQNARVEKSFDVKWMDQKEFKDFKYQSSLIRRPITLKVTKCHWISYRSITPDKILSKKNHDTNNWDEHLVLDLIGNRIEELPAFNTQMLRLCYENTLAIDGKKLADIKKLMQFLSGDQLEFYTNLMNRQENEDDEEEEGI